MVVSYKLYTRNPEEIKEVIPCAIEETKVQSEMHEEAIVPTGYTTIESIAEFLEQQGCVYSVSYDRE